MVLLGDGDVQPKETEVPTVPKKVMSSCCVSSIPRCILSKKFQDIMRKKEQEKKELKEAKECKGKCLENAEEKKRCQEEAKKKQEKEKTKIKKAKAAALAAPRPKCD